MSIEKGYVQSPHSRGVLCVWQNLDYYSNQFIFVASDTVLTCRCFAATMNQLTYINNDKVAPT